MNDIDLNPDATQIVEPGVIEGVDPSTGEPYRLGMLTSGGDAPGMNAAVRAVVRTALAAGAVPFAILEGWEGAIRGGDSIRQMDWGSVSAILNRGGTAIGTARSNDFRLYEGRLTAVENMLGAGIDRLVVIGGDGSLSGADELRGEWTQILGDLVEQGRITQELADSHPELTLVGLVGSIDNDLVGSDMTIGADTALERIVTAMDQLSSTAASHQRTFIVEVMGRRCGYLPLMAAVAGGADYVFTPESPAGPGWEDELCQKLVMGREAGRRESMVLVAEGALDTAGNPLTSADIANAIKDRLGEDPRITILGHVQRGGAPSAYDRWMSTLLGYCAVQEILDSERYGDAVILGVRRNRVSRLPMVETIKDTRAVGALIKAGDYETARKARGASYYDMGEIYKILSDPPTLHTDTDKSVRVAILHSGGLAPGMNTAARATVRIGLHHGWTMLGIEGSWEGLSGGEVRELSWDDVEGWAFDGGATLGTRRHIPQTEEYYALGRAIEEHSIDALVVIGGYSAYDAVREMTKARSHFPALAIPTILVPASIDNNLPGTELSVGADTAINNAVWALDRIKESAAASRRCFVAETMGRKCGYLAMMSGMASGAEYVYLNEEPLTLAGLSKDIDALRKQFEEGRRLFLVVMNEETSTHYDRDFISRAIEAAGEGLFDVRDSALGYIQQGGAPTVFDRLLATRFANGVIRYLEKAFETGDKSASYIGTGQDGIRTEPISRMEEIVDEAVRRPKNQWWLALQNVTQTVSLEGADIPVGRIDVPAVEPVVPRIQERIDEVTSTQEQN